MIAPQLLQVQIRDTLSGYIAKGLQICKSFKLQMKCRTSLADTVKISLQGLRLLEEKDLKIHLMTRKW